MSIELYLSFVTAAVILIIIPGPTNMVVVSSSMKFGFKKSVWTVIGATASHTFFFAVTSLGIAAILLASAKVFELIKWIGVVYLIFHGIKLWISGDVQHETGKSESKTSASYLFLQGFAVNTTNPKALIFYSAFFPPFVNPASPAMPQLLLMGFTFITIFMLTALFHGYIADRAQAFFYKPRQIILQNRIAGSLLIGAGLLLAVTKRN